MALSSWPMMATLVIAGGFILMNFVVNFLRKPKAWKRFTRISDRMYTDTPCRRSEWLTEYLNNKSVVQLKMEAMQHSGSFEIRGISKFMEKAIAMKDVSTFVTTSASNAGIATAYVAREMGKGCRVIVEESQRENQMISMMKSHYGVEVELKGSSWNEADEYAQEQCRKSEGLMYVPMCGDHSIYEGNSTMIRELKKQIDTQPDCIVCSVGGSGLLMGVLHGVNQLGWSRETQVVAAQSERYALYDAAVENGYEQTPRRCISVEGVDLGSRTVTKDVLSTAKRWKRFNPIKSMKVKDEDVLNAATLFGLKEGVMIDSLCAVAVAAIIKNKDYFMQFKNIVVIVGGGNDVHFDVEMLREARQNGFFEQEEPKIITVSDTEYAHPMQKKQGDAEISGDDMDYYDSDEEEM